MPQWPNSGYNFGGTGSFPGGVYKTLFLNFDIKSVLLKTNGSPPLVLKRTFLI